MRTTTTAIGTFEVGLRLDWVHLSPSHQAPNTIIWTYGSCETQTKLFMVLTKGDEKRNERREKSSSHIEWHNGRWYMEFFVCMSINESATACSAKHFFFVENTARERKDSNVWICSCCLCVSYVISCMNEPMNRPNQANERMKNDKKNQNEIAFVFVWYIQVIRMCCAVICMRQDPRTLRTLNTLVFGVFCSLRCVEREKKTDKRPCHYVARWIYIWEISVVVVVFVFVAVAIGVGVVVWVHTSNCRSYIFRIWNIPRTRQTKMRLGGWKRVSEYTASTQIHQKPSTVYFVRVDREHLGGLACNV